MRVEDHTDRTNRGRSIAPAHRPAPAPRAALSTLQADAGNAAVVQMLRQAGHSYAQEQHGFSVQRALSHGPAGAAAAAPAGNSVPGAVMRFDTRHPKEIFAGGFLPRGLPENAEERISPEEVLAHVTGGSENLNASRVLSVTEDGDAALSLFNGSLLKTMKMTYDMASMDYDPDEGPNLQQIMVEWLRRGAVASGYTVSEDGIRLTRRLWRYVIITSPDSYRNAAEVIGDGHTPGSAAHMAHVTATEQREWVTRQVPSRMVTSARPVSIALDIKPFTGASDMAIKDELNWTVDVGNAEHNPAFTGHA